MKLSTMRVLERIAHPSERPEAAFFSSYTFDPAFFEEHILRAILQLKNDPEDQPARFHEEARRALQEIPIAVVVDGGMRQPGHRLPYELLEVHTRVFHPKLALLLYPDFARLSVGSGNLTRGGYGENSETFDLRDLAYDVPEDAALLREVYAFLSGLDAYLHAPGTQLEVLRSTLERRIEQTSVPRTRSTAFLHSLERPLLAQFRELLPPSSTLLGVGLLAPFFERDDVNPEGSQDTTSILHALATPLSEKHAAPTIDLGMLWEDPPLIASAAAPADNAAALVGKLCVRNNPTGPDYFVVRGFTPKQLEVSDAKGASRRLTRDDEQLTSRELGIVSSIVAYAPAHAVASLAAEHTLRTWLHPAWRFSEGKPRRRPLHAKLFLFEVKERGALSTFVVVGSPNPSSRALGRSTREGGNVECAIAFRVDGELRLPDICPELVHVPTDMVSPRERQYPEGEPNLAAWISSALHDAKERTLAVSWAATGPAPLREWKLTYGDRELASGIGPGTTPTCVPDFVLSPSRCEIDLHVGPQVFTIPINVVDLAELPVSAHLADLGLRELLALLGKRVGSDRLATFRQERGPQGMAPVLEAIFGEGFGPTDVFRAFWSLADSMGAEAMTPAAFKLHLVGPMSARMLWSRLREAAVEGNVLTEEELFFYGAELLAAVRGVSVPLDSNHDAKSALLHAFCEELCVEVGALVPAEQPPWMPPVLAHYGLGSEVSA